jgi:hypothetical protein
MSRYPLLFAGAVLVLSGAVAAGAPQVCTVGAVAAGSQGTLVCRDSATGAATQSIALGNTTVGKGGTGGTLSRHGNTVLVTNQSDSALVLKREGSRLSGKVVLDTHGRPTYSGAVTANGNYVVTADRILFFPNGRRAAQSSEALLVGDGSVSQVAVVADFAYVAEKSGTLEAFALAHDGNLVGPGVNVSGVPAGTIVGITALEGLVIAPVAHLATNANQAAISVASGREQIQLVETKEVAACWAANDGREACITNPGSMTVSCGRFGPGGFRSYTSAAAHPAGDSLLDIDMDEHYVVAVGTDKGAAVLTTFSRSREDGDFLTFVSEVPAGAAVTTGALILPAE